MSDHSRTFTTAQVNGRPIEIHQAHLFTDEVSGPP